MSKPLVLFPPFSVAISQLLFLNIGTFDLAVKDKFMSPQNRQEQRGTHSKSFEVRLSVSHQDSVTGNMGDPCHLFEAQRHHPNSHGEDRDCNGRM